MLIPVWLYWSLVVLYVLQALLLLALLVVGGYPRVRVRTASAVAVELFWAVVIVVVLLVVRA